jgi:N-acylneuraminate cytidylyltransferase
MKENVAFFLPTRRGSQRVKNKNTRPFAGIEGGLMENKICQLIKSMKIDEIILSSNDEYCMDIVSRYKSDSRIKIIERPNELCLDTTNLQDLICYVPTVTEAQHILWGHVTTPICDAAEYDKAIDLYFSKLTEDYDSLVSVVELKNFLLNNEGRLINNTTPLPWPRTQDLEALYEINHAIFLAKREVYIKQKNRIGNKPLLYLMNKFKSYDVDWEDDFVIAETLYKILKKEQLS